MLYKINQETDKYLAGAVFNLYTRDDIYDVNGNKLFSAGDLISTSPETLSRTATPISTAMFPSAASGTARVTDWMPRPTAAIAFIRELRAPLGYYLNDAEMDVTFTYGGRGSAGTGQHLRQQAY